ncbi:MAG: DUF4249 domain-containing protein [Cyclobacteriaceae bacterium]|nr:DUF4249 domain-containing protein [Cyclobacteriaceae bacterium]
MIRSRVKKLVVKVSLQIIPFLLLVGCLTPITIETDKVGGSIVISGQVSSLNDRNIVQIGTASQDARLPFPLSGAMVQLFDGMGNDFYYSESLPGIYKLENFSGVPGVPYSLRVTLPDGTIYESDPEKMPEAVGTINTSFVVANEAYIDGEGTPSNQDFISIYHSSNLIELPAKSYLRWSVEETFIISPTDYPDISGSIPPPCFITETIDPQRIVLFDKTISSGTSIQNQFLGRRIIDYSFLEKHYFSSYQTALTANAYEYWRKINILANQVGSIFDTPPARIEGNIKNIKNYSEEVLGYFQAVNENVDRIVIFPSMLEVPLEFQKCDFTGNFNPLDYPTRCYDCLRVRNSTYDRPVWF